MTAKLAEDLRPPALITELGPWAEPRPPRVIRLLLGELECLALPPARCQQVGQFTGTGGGDPPVLGDDGLGEGSPQQLLGLGRVRPLHGLGQESKGARVLGWAG